MHIIKNTKAFMRFNVASVCKNKPTPLFNMPFSSYYRDILSKLSKNLNCQTYLQQFNSELPLIMFML